jgi:hypothetical protein
VTRSRLVALTTLTLLTVLLVPTPTANAATPWKPAVGARWQYQLTGKIRTDLCVVPASGGVCVRPEVYDIDLYNNDGTALNTAAVAQVHAVGAKAVCYVSAGSFENFRPDRAAFPPSVKGKSNGWPGESWLDVRQISVLLPIMAARVDLCVSAGFDAVEFDNVDGYTNDTGFPLTAADQFVYNWALAMIAHARGLSAGLKNDVEQAGELLPYFDFAINEQCAQYSECGVYDAWTAAGKAVLQIEYTKKPKVFCADSVAGRRSGIKKSLALKATPWTPCN